MYTNLEQHSPTLPPAFCAFNCYASKDNFPLPCQGDITILNTLWALHKSPYNLLSFGRWRAITCAASSLDSRERSQKQRIVSTCMAQKRWASPAGNVTPLSFTFWDTGYRLLDRNIFRAGDDSVVMSTHYLIRGLVFGSQHSHKVAHKCL